ncbi:tryptophan-rich sensory protein [bacterium SCSIO 12643]|nr:tryptophan-rich sensory protein [bacterium SCSIO 12643]
MIGRVLIFLVLNFAALALGSLFTAKGVPSDWYVGLNKAPWTPPGWMFGFAWTSIMICFALYMSYLWPQMANKKLLILLFAGQWILNVSWNPAFFHFHQVSIALIIIVSLTILIGYLLLSFWPILKLKSTLLFPYFIWLLIATSLNGYILLKN